MIVLELEVIKETPQKRITLVRELDKRNIYIKKERLEIFMTIAAVIAEYNPFHNGHAYQLREIRRQTGADLILVMMSGDFVQRGAPPVQTNTPDAVWPWPPVQIWSVNSRFTVPWAVRKSLPNPLFLC
mgnify:CR=1 FL=1